jgi:hypothetical protein
LRKAMQLPDGEEPDWTAHWNAGFYIQFALVILCNAIAGMAWFFAAYRPYGTACSMSLRLDC